MSQLDLPTIAIMIHQISKQDILEWHKSFKQHSRKVVKKSDLITNISLLLITYETFYNTILKFKQLPPNFFIDKTKLARLSQNELLGIHTLFRKHLKYTNTKQNAINNILNLSNQIQYFINY
jgi:hypothetical protein